MKKFLIWTMALVLVLMPISVKAATTGAITLTASEGIVEANDEFTVVVKASDSNNLNTVEYTGITVTDSNGRETTAIKLKSAEVIGSWSGFEYDGKQAYVYSGSVTQAADLLKLTFTVSDKAEAGTYKINVNGLTVYSTNLSDDTTTIGTKTATVVIEAKEVEEPKEENKNENTTGNTTQKPNNNKVDNSVSGGNKLPQTGVESAVIIGIAALTVVSVVLYRVLKRYRDI